MPRKRTRLTEEDVKASNLAYSRRYEASERGKKKRAQRAARKHRRKQLPLCLDGFARNLDEEIYAEADFTPPRHKTAFQQSFKGELGFLFPFVMAPPYTEESLHEDQARTEMRNPQILGFKVQGRLMNWEDDQESMWLEELRLNTRLVWLEKRAAEVERMYEHWLRLSKLDEEGFDESTTVGKVTAALTKIHRAWAARRVVRLRELSCLEDV
uniref:Uncharacterized protein n=1 Tax=Mycena chlorophos TaxID=658473 RepID=A0ABQ0KWG7_MYCCL|nr:predicted protein [Mycena chlorophos]